MVAQVSTQRFDIVSTEFVSSQAMLGVDLGFLHSETGEILTAVSVTFHNGASYAYFGNHQNLTQFADVVSQHVADEGQTRVGHAFNVLVRPLECVRLA